MTKGGNIKKKVRISVLGVSFCCFEFENEEDLTAILSRGPRKIEDKIVELQRWNPEAGCLRKGGIVKEGWVRLVGLPLHLWCKKLFKKLGDSCVAFIVVDEDTTFLCNKQWAWVCVRLNENSRPSLVQIRVGCYCYVIQLWWEFFPWLV